MDCSRRTEWERTRKRVLPDVSGINGAPVAPIHRRIDHPYLVAFPQPPEMIRQQSPYDGIPSLYDMYVQASPALSLRGGLGRKFLRMGRETHSLISDGSPGWADYVVGPGDGLSVDLWGGVSQRLYRTVDREVAFSLPVVGPI